MIKPHRSHPLWLAYLVHRLSGIALALFLPLHFYVLSLALNEQAALDSFLAFSAHPLVKLAIFVYEFLSIHPFQDGNGRLSRLLTNLLLLQHGYRWVQYVSMEHEIENRKSTYYQVLRSCQGQRPNENVTEWITFFFEVLVTIQDRLMQKLAQLGVDQTLSVRDKEILAFIMGHPGCKSGQVSRQLNIPAPTVKRLLSQMVENHLLERHGSGAGTTYTAN